MLKSIQARQEPAQEAPAQAALDTLAAYIELHEITQTEALETIRLYRDLCHAITECPSTKGMAVIKSGGFMARRSRANPDHAVII